MNQIELTVLSRDVDSVIEFLGHRGIMQFSENETLHETPDKDSANAQNEAIYRHLQENLDKLNTAAAYLGLSLPLEPEESSHVPTEGEEALVDIISGAVSALSKQEFEQNTEKKKVEDALNEAKAFANINAPFSDLDQLSYLTLRIGRLDPRRQDELRENLGDRAIVIPLDPSGERVMAAASRKGRFALDSELKKAKFVPISIPEGYKGVPRELLLGLEIRLKDVEQALHDIADKKQVFRDEYGADLKSLIASYLMASIMEQLKSRLFATKNIYFLSGWVPADTVKTLVDEMEKLTENRTAIRSFNPNEVAAVREGKEKVPVSLAHGKLVKGFEGVVFSYGAPLYGTIDPTFFVAIFFTFLFGIMFGDVGQGLVLFTLGILCGRKGIPFFSNFKKFSVPLKSVGTASMVMGLLTGSFFANEHFFIAPTRAITELITGQPMDRILTILPLAEAGGSITKLFYFFGFTIAIGVILNSIGLIVNIINKFILKKYEKAVFSKTGLAGAFFFWYALFIVIRFILSSVNPELSFKFAWFDVVCLVTPVLGIFFGPALWRLILGKKPVFEEGMTVFIMEGFVEVLEIISTYISNTVSFLRVGAFALSHAVLSFIIFNFAEQVSGVTAGTAFSLLIIVFGNLVIILLEGLIVAIQVVRLQYYEFFSK
ncbi:MAG: V-type ATP synthase subunit I, partial [Treponema sp.]|nr:V-type ATP synthase subunit I [Treponema sp.]